MGCALCEALRKQLAEHSVWRELQFCGACGQRLAQGAPLRAPKQRHRFICQSEVVSAFSCGQFRALSLLVLHLVHPAGRAGSWEVAPAVYWRAGSRILNCGTG